MKQSCNKKEKTEPKKYLRDKTRKKKTEKHFNN